MGNGRGRRPSLKHRSTWPEPVETKLKPDPVLSRDPSCPHRLPLQTPTSFHIGHCPKYSSYSPARRHLLREALLTLPGHLASTLLRARPTALSRDLPVWARLSRAGTEGHSSPGLSVLALHLSMGGSQQHWLTQRMSE